MVKNTHIGVGLVHLPRRLGLLVSRGVNEQRWGEHTSPVGSPSPLFFLFKSQPRRPGLLVSCGRMDSKGANAPAPGGGLLLFSAWVRIPVADFLAQVSTCRMTPRGTDLTHGPGLSDSSIEEVGDCWYTTESTCPRDITPANGGL